VATGAEVAAGAAGAAGASVTTAVGVPHAASAIAAIKIILKSKNDFLAIFLSF
jgi:hypothetical protein